MITVAAQHGAQVGVVPLIEIEVVAEGRFATRIFGIIVSPVARPLVEGLIKDVESELIAQIVEFRSERMMAGADGIAAHLFEEAETIRPNGDWNSVAKGPRVLMHANALELGGFAIHEQAPIGNEFKFANAESRGGFVELPVSQRQAAAQPVKFGCFVGPKARV